MRTLSLVNCVVLDVPGSVLKNAVCFDDVDNDGLNEFIIGTSEGDLNIFRNDQCICTSSDLGSISAVAVGDLLNISKNVLVVVTVEGWCHIFDVEAELAAIERKTPDGETSPPQCLQPEALLIWPCHSQRVPPNTKTLNLGDVNGDGLVEMIIGLTDRVVRTYQWKAENQDQDDEDKLEEEQARRDEVYEGRFYGMNKWEFSSQVGSIALHSQGGVTSILVGQPGGTVKRITERPVEEDESKTVAPHSSSTSTITSSLTSKISRSEFHETGERRSSIGNITIDFYTLDISHMNNQNISCEVAGNVFSSNGDQNDCYALATLDGTIIIAKENQIQWSFQVHHQIMSLFQIDGNLLACTWDGETYFIKNKIPTRFHFEDSVATFVPGLYAVKDERYSTDKLSNKLCMAFVTFAEKVYIYTMPIIV